MADAWKNQKVLIPNGGLMVMNPMGSKSEKHNQQKQLQMAECPSLEESSR